MKAGMTSIIVAMLVLLVHCPAALSEWTEPAPLTEVNTNYHDTSPFLSFDGLTLYFCRFNGPWGWTNRIYQAKRAEPTGPFTSVEEISTLNLPDAHVADPWVSPDNLRMYYWRSGGGRARIMLTTRASVNDPWLPGVEISELSILGNVRFPTLTADELTIVFCGDNLPGGMGSHDIWIATRPNTTSPFSNVRNLAEINSSSIDAHSSLSPDGLTLHFYSDRNGTPQLFKATRESLNAPFNNLEHLSFFDCLDCSLTYPFLSSDGKTFYFVKTIDGQQLDIFVSYLSTLQWSEPVPLTEVNTKYYEEWAPFLSFDGLSLYFSRVRQDSSYYGRIYQASRDEPSGPFTSIREISELNQPKTYVLFPWVSADNLRMYYHIEDGLSWKLMLSERPSITDPWPQGEGISELNALSPFVQVPRLTEDELTIFFTSPEGAVAGAQQNIWMATRPDRNSPFSQVRKLDEINTSSHDAHAFPSPDGLQLYFTSNRNGNFQLFKATRESIDAPFGPAEHLPLFDTPNGHSAHPCISSDGKAFYFARSLSCAPWDIWVSYLSEIPPPPPPPTTYYVDADASCANNGSSWPNAYRYLQSALARAASVAKPVEIRVAGGIYKPDEGTNQKLGARTATFQLISGVTIKGGYAGFVGPDPNARDIDRYESILTGDIGISGNKNDNSYHILTGSGVEPNAVLDGFTITAGNANGDDANGVGAGMLNIDGSPTLHHCTFFANSAKYDAGAIFNICAIKPTLTNCLFFANSSGLSGGAIYNEGEPNKPSRLSLTNCTFNQNTALEGGALYNSTDSNSTLLNCILWRNNPDEVQNDQTPTSIVNITYSDIKGSWPGKGNINADPCFAEQLVPLEPDGLVAHWKFDEGTGTIAHDSAGNNHGIIHDAKWTSGIIGGALNFDGDKDYVQVPDSDSLTPANQITICFWVYTRGGQVAGIYKHAWCPGEPDSPGNSRAYNLCVSENGSAMQVFSSVDTYGYIINNNPVSLNEWHHIAGTFNEGQAALYVDGHLKFSEILPVSLIMNDAQPLTIGGFWEYCGTDSFESGLNGLADDVRIYNRALSAEEIYNLCYGGLTKYTDYRLLPTSPCIDTGDPNYTPDPNETDIDSNPRLVGPAVDMGAYEAQPVIKLDLNELIFKTGQDCNNPTDQILTISNAGIGTLNWQITCDSNDCNWLSIDPNSGCSEKLSPGVQVTIKVNTRTLNVGNYSCNLVVSDPNAENNPQMAKVRLVKYCFPCSPDYAQQWNSFIEVGAPNCWCGIYGNPPCPYQCDGDADNNEQIVGWRVYTNDLAILANNWKKKTTDPTFNPCADFDHKAQVDSWRVYTNDLTILATSWRKKSTQLPGNCPRPDYNINAP